MFEIREYDDYETFMDSLRTTVDDNNQSLFSYTERWYSVFEEQWGGPPREMETDKLYSLWYKPWFMVYTGEKYLLIEFTSVDTMNHGMTWWWSMRKLVNYKLMPMRRNNLLPWSTIFQILSL